MSASWGKGIKFFARKGKFPAELYICSCWIIVK